MSLFGEKCRPLSRIFPETWESLEFLKNHSQLPNILFYYHFLVHFIIISRFTELILNYTEVFLSKRWGYLGKESSIEADTSRNRGIPCKVLKITHNYLIFLFYYHFFGSLSHHFKVHRVDLWLYWDSLVRGEDFCEKFQPLRQIRPETGESIAKS